jgi:hypothetical protein
VECGWFFGRCPKNQPPLPLFASGASNSVFIKKGFATMIFSFGKAFCFCTFAKKCTREIYFPIETVLAENEFPDYN